MASIAAALPENFGTDPIQLLSFQDYTQNHYENTYEESPDWFTLITSWGNSSTWDLKSSFAWGLGNEIDTETSQTEQLVFNPYVDLYGYWSGVFWAEREDSWWFEARLIY